MLIERIYDEDLAQASYFIGRQAKNTAVVVDPRRDIDVYRAMAEKNGMTIVAVTETHIHADYLSGTRELAAAVGADVYVSGEGGQDWQYEFDAKRLHDGDEIRIGNITIAAVHTPGHTPEHLSYKTPMHLIARSLTFIDPQTSLLRTFRSVRSTGSL